MLTVKAKIPAQADYEPILPLAVPDLKEVKAFAGHLHSLGAYWRGEIFGWQAEYTPESDKKPLDSNMTFTPADFWIGESGIWFFPSCGNTARIKSRKNFWMIGVL